MRAGQAGCSDSPTQAVLKMERFEELYRTHVDAVFRYALRCVGRRDVAEDITSEAFLALYRNLESIDVTQLPGWLLTVAKNRAHDYWRHAQVEQRNTEASCATVLPPPPLEHSVLGNPCLKPVHRVCLLLRYVYGMTLAEVSQHTGMSPTQVKGHLQYARQLLRKALAASNEYSL